MTAVTASFASHSPFGLVLPPPSLLNPPLPTPAPHVHCPTIVPLLELAFHMSVHMMKWIKQLIGTMMTVNVSFSWRSLFGPVLPRASPLRHPLLIPAPHYLCTAIVPLLGLISHQSVYKREFIMIIEIYI